MFWVMQNSEDIQGKYYGISRFSHLTLTLLRMIIYDKTVEPQLLGPVTVAPALRWVPKTFAAKVDPCFLSPKKSCSQNVLFPLKKTYNGKHYCNICCCCVKDFAGLKVHSVTAFWLILPHKIRSETFFFFSRNTKIFIESF